MRFSDTRRNRIKRIKYLAVETLFNSNAKKYHKVSSSYDKLKQEIEANINIGNLYYVESDEDNQILDLHDKLASALANFPLDLEESPPKFLVMFNETKIYKRDNITDLLTANKLFFDIDDDAYHDVLLKRAPHMTKNFDEFDILLLCNIDGVVTDYMLSTMNYFIKNRKPVIFLENNFVEYRG